MTQALIVGGTFDRDGGKRSKIIESLSKATGWPVLNGGTLAQLSSVDFAAVDVLVWAPNVSNDEEKILPGIKAKNPKLVLISTKRVVEKAYSNFDVIARLLKSKSNLGIKMTSSEGRYSFQLLDPLGNCFCDTQSVEELAAALLKRVGEIRAMKRIGSVSLGVANDRCLRSMSSLSRWCACSAMSSPNMSTPSIRSGSSATPRRVRPTVLLGAAMVFLPCAALTTARFTLSPGATSTRQR